MKLTFLGTRGEIEARTRRHRMHSSLLIVHRRKRIMIDCGADWLGKIARVRPDAILLTHAHPDHAWGLRRGAPCPVFATAVTLRAIARYPISQQHEVIPGQMLRLFGLRIEPYILEHSITAPAVGYRVMTDDAAFFYASDVVFIHDRERAMRGVQLYIGDAATISRPFIRKRGDALIGHSPIKTQLGWCQRMRIIAAVFTHCGSEIVTGDGRALARLVARMGAELAASRPGSHMMDSNWYLNRSRTGDGSNVITPSHFGTTLRRPSFPNASEAYNRQRRRDRACYYGTNVFRSPYSKAAFAVAVG